MFRIKVTNTVSHDVKSRPCNYYQSGKCKQHVFDSVHVDRRNGNRAYTHICTLCLDLLSAGTKEIKLVYYPYSCTYMVSVSLINPNQHKID